MRLALPPYALVFPGPSDQTDAPASVRRPLELAAIPARNPRLRAELCTFSILLFLNFVKYVVLGGALGCG